MVFPCKIPINQYAKIFYICLLIEEDQLIIISVNTPHLEELTQSLIVPQYISIWVTYNWSVVGLEILSACVSC